ncbi:hypothetical protein DERP_003087 [Dermatophagoides pteronyssinus]|uniref:Uncharacterized protein n=1 Tax=Dermatophagoides pteronyssinus TaxID=6956 RepID=A0ABQ8JJ94_DERPT|nr:hypothetical protein DERP_003087 [Dermatophagoides pteronyssinus]
MHLAQIRFIFDFELICRVCAFGFFNLQNMEYSEKKSFSLTNMSFDPRKFKLIELYQVEKCKEFESLMQSFPGKFP